jgi:hypothetical protein
VLRPTLFLGVGGLAGLALRHLKERLQQRFGNLEGVPILRLLLLDTDRLDLRTARAADLDVPGPPPLALEETLLTPLQPQEHYRDRARAYLRWLDRRWLYGIPRSQTTEGMRPLGRLALVDNAAEVLARLRQELAALVSAEARALTTSSTGLALREEAPRVFLVASVAGGTGGGMLVTLAYAVQQVLAELHLPADAVCGLLLHATSPKPTEGELARANALATLQEINHFSHPDNSYPGDPEHELAGAAAGQGPLPECYLVPLGEQLSKESAEAATDVVAEYLCLDSTSTAGGLLDEYRVQTRSPWGPPVLRTFGLSRIRFPRQALADLAARRFCQDVVQGWRGRVKDREFEAIRESTQRQAERLGLEEETLVRRLRRDVDGILGNNPDHLFAQLAVSGPAEECGPASGPEAPAATLRRIDEVLGPAPASEGAAAGAATPFETDLQQHADKTGQCLAESALGWLLEWVEDPEHRLQAAQLAGRCLNEHLRAVIEDASARLAQLRVQRHGLRLRLLKGDSGSTIKLMPIPWLGQREAEKRTGRVVDYCWVRLAELVLEAAIGVLASVSRELSPFLQDLVLCQHKLNVLAEQFAPPATRHAPAGPEPANGIEVLPWGAASRAEAAAALLERLEPGRVRRFEEDLMAAVVDPHGGVGAALGIVNAPDLSRGGQASSSLAFWNLVTSPGEMAQKLTERMIGQAQGFIQESLAELDAAGLFLAATPAEQVEAVVSAQVQATRSGLVLPGAWEHLVAALPESPAGQALGDLVRHSAACQRSESGELSLSVCPSPLDVCLVREVAAQPLPAVAGALAHGQPGAAALAQRVLTRHDVGWLALPAS